MATHDAAHLPSPISQRVTARFLSVIFTIGTISLTSAISSIVDSAHTHSSNTASNEGAEHHHQVL